jgi:hypothetical protein
MKPKIPTTGHGTLIAGSTSAGRPLRDEKRRIPLGKLGACREPSGVLGEAGDPASGDLAPNSKHRLTLGKGKADLTLGAYEVVTENVVIVGKKATGKSYFAHVLVEEMLSLYRQPKLMSAGVSVVIFAPSGGWWGIRAGRSGSARGASRVLTIGGEHADFTLDRRMGARIADLVDAVRPLPLLVEMGEMAVAEQQELVADFAERLAMSQACRLLHIVLDEAEDFFPTSPVNGPQLRAARALDTLIRKRRTRGIAVTTVASRLTNLNRNVTSQTGRFFLFGMSSPQDIDAVGELVRYGSPQDVDQLSAQVVRLAPGEAIHLTHGKKYGHVRFRVRRLRTYDSHQLPPIGTAERKPDKLATITSKTMKIARATLFPAKPTVAGPSTRPGSAPAQSSSHVPPAKGNIPRP